MYIHILRFNGTAYAERFRKQVRLGSGVLPVRIEPMNEQGTLALFSTEILSSDEIDAVFSEANRLHLGNMDPDIDLLGWEWNQRVDFSTYEVLGYKMAQHLRIEYDPREKGWYVMQRTSADAPFSFLPNEHGKPVKFLKGIDARAWQLCPPQIPGLLRFSEE